MSRVLVIGDTHCPCMREGYLDFLVETYGAWDCDRVVHIGDLVDNCALSFHTKNPRLKDPMRELDEAMEQVAEITSAFPVVDMLIGNHDALPFRWATEVGVPTEYLRDPKSLWGLPDEWNVVGRYGQLVIDDVIYQHGDRGRAGAVLNAKDEFKSVVQGHHHSKAGVTFFANKHARIFGMQVGCGVDDSRLAMEYGKKYTSKSILGCGVVLDGITPIFEPMHLGSKK